MSPVLALGFSAFLIAFTGAMAPGPYLTVTVTRTLREGPRAAALMLVGHAALEGALLVGFAFGLHRVLRAPSVSAGIALAGGAFLLWMGGDLLNGVLRGTVHLNADGATAEPTAMGPVAHGAAVSLSNPYWSLWWATIGVKLALDGLSLGPWGVAAFFVGHQLADVMWYGIVIRAVHSGRRILRDGSYRVLLGACAVFLLAVAVRFLWEGGQRLL